MRLSFATLLFAVSLVQPVWAAPTCQDRSGMTIRCGVDGAMPVGWTLPAGVGTARDTGRGAASDTSQMWKAAVLVALLLALFAAMPEFDGTADKDWERQERDD